MARPSIGAYAIRRSDPESAPLLADSQETLNKVIALRWIGEWIPDDDTAAAPVRRAIASFSRSARGSGYRSSTTFATARATTSRRIPEDGGGASFASSFTRIPGGSCGT